MGSRSTTSPARSASEEFLRFTGSIAFDKHLWRYDIAGSIAHAHTLARASVITDDDLGKIITGLRAVAADISDGSVAFDPSLEDIHMTVEKLLIDRVGEVGMKLHTGRSRNDQIALDMRLYVRESIAKTVTDLAGLQSALLGRASGSIGAVMPGMTHMQHAQPVLLSHHLMAYFWKLQRDIERLTDCYARSNMSPLGSGALAGTAFGLDRRIAASMLGMAGVTENSMDAVSDRDFVAETAFALSLLMVHLSSLCEEIVIWSSQEFGFVVLPEEMSSGSSMMPQKKNPDLPELVRGKTGRVVGDLVAVLTSLKSLPLAYNRDLQEDKECLFDAVDTAGASLHALTLFLHAMRFDEARMRKAAGIGLMTATDLADFLAKEGVPFRAAHKMVKKLAVDARGDDQAFADLARKMLRERFGRDGFLSPQLTSAEKSAESKLIEGGTSSAAVRAQVKKAKAVLSRTKKVIREMTAQTSRVDALLSGGA